MKTTPYRISKAQQLKETKAYVEICFYLLEDQSFAELAKTTGLCVSTLYRLHAMNFTLAVRHGTILALGNAAGIRLTFKQNKAKLSFVA